MRGFEEPTTRTVAEVPDVVPDPVADGPDEAPGRRRPGDPGHGEADAAGPQVFGARTTSRSLRSSLIAWSPVGTSEFFPATPITHAVHLRMPDQDELIEALRRLDPGKPPPDDHYVDRTAYRWSLPEKLPLLLAAGHRLRLLMPGGIGTGKTTELQRMAAAMRSPELWTQVIQLDPQNIRTLGSVIKQQMDARRKQRPHSQFLFFVDGLDRAALSVFGPASPLCAPGLPSVVYSAPQRMVLQSSTERDSRFDTTLHHVAPLPVLDRNGRVDAGVVEAFAQGLKRRFQGLSVMSDIRLFRRVALASGGIPRDAVVILRSAVLAAASHGQIELAHVLEGERELRQDLMQSLSASDITLLMNVFTYKSTTTAGDELAHQRAVLAYEDQDSRYWLPHALLWHLMSPADEQMRQALATA